MFRDHQGERQPAKLIVPPLLRPLIRFPAEWPYRFFLSLGAVSPAELSHTRLPAPRAARAESEFRSADTCPHRWERSRKVDQLLQTRRGVIPIHVGEILGRHRRRADISIGHGLVVDHHPSRRSVV